MGEMLFASAAYAEETRTGGGLTTSQIVTSTPSTAYKITAAGDDYDEATGVRVKRSASTTRRKSQPWKSPDGDYTGETDVKTLTSHEASLPSHTEADTQPQEIGSSYTRTQISPAPLVSQEHAPLLHLPLEIRLQIYRWVLLLSTVDRKPGSTATAATTTNDSAMSVSSTLFHCMPPYFFDSPQHFGPGDGIMFMNMFASNEHQRPLHFRRLRPKPPTNETPQEDHRDQKSTVFDDVPLLASYRPVGRALPVGLLVSCRQVYREARTIAFETSEFVFVRLFCSGLSTAHSFIVLGSQSYPGNVGGGIPLLQPWQRDCLRHVRLELDVSVADMGWTGPERDPKYVAAEGSDASKDGPKIMDGPKWLALCDALANGLHGMRVLLNITEEQYDMNAERDEGTKEDDEYTYTPDEAAAAARSVLVEGFTRLAALRQLEIELAWVLRGRFRSRAANLTPAAARDNLMWCAAVETAIHAARQARLETTAVSRASESTRRPVLTKVVCVERIYDEELEKERAFVEGSGF
ncbi:hypothetical protein SPBR_05872 [Sporothrix brasiliensis 5110]|uniref:Uncharacterized protein n=1 Tax=Sporothrix brasiliensis 5110 TaxID=1398154 RepID=A0A0C2J5U4_9PEZI|nr:uncharacterized protein SPBR_05872 [Sporothrix brasiliensis 5110]KIH94365.1 hypothetical protein SPBR_05872 [Sporothrix brasiliensis 5110]